jgi:P4 family phage/plasmid primase-like protien
MDEVKEIFKPIETVGGSMSQSGLEVFVSGYIALFPKNKWEEEVWPMVKNFNLIHTPPLELIALRELYERAKEAEFQRTEVTQEADLRKEFVKNKAKGTYNLAKYLTDKYNIITVGEKEREMYVYRDGMYFRAENEIIFPEIQRILSDLVTKSAKMETFHKIADMTSCPRSVLSDADRDCIPLRNGVYDMRTKTLLEHSPKYRFTYQFPIMFDPEADCPKTKAFMGQILDAGQRQVVEEWIGYYFYRLYSFKKAIIFVGEGDTGKTTLLETVMFLLGKENVSSVSLQKMTSDRFSAAHLYEKHGNLVDELSARDISDTGNFKIATGGGSISGEYKFGNQFSFQNFAKFTFACNKIPDVTDFDDEAYFNRWIVIRFENPIVKKIPNFIATLTTEEERSGLFNLAMLGLERLLRNGGFSYTKTAVETKLEMMRSGSAIAQFAAEGVRQDEASEITKESMYNAYSKFCVSRGLAIDTKDLFGKKFLFYVAYATEGLVYDTDTANNGKRVRGWRGVAVVTSEEEKKQDETF